MLFGVFAILIAILRSITAKIYPLSLSPINVLNNHSFLNNQQLDKAIRREFEETRWISFKYQQQHERKEENEDIEINLHSSTVLNPKRIQFLFKEFDNQRFIKLRSVPFTIKNVEWASKLEQGFKRATYRQLECSK